MTFKTDVKRNSLSTIQYNKNLELEITQINCFVTFFIVYKNIFESLILAQEKRWRRT